ncbi:hypothetical protein DRN79_03975 [Methanosarcinales archaeon]|nr:MAG: hypothetical protein DRN79_03975 [Methanosarcinales archaeon]
MAISQIVHSEYEKYTQYMNGSERIMMNKMFASRVLKSYCFRYKQIAYRFLLMDKAKKYVIAIGKMYLYSYISLKKFFP